MSTLIYSPGISMVIDTVHHGYVDVSEDIVSGSVSLRENSSHTFNITLNNVYRKYDGIFTPNDRVSIQMKRLTWLQVFTGYLNRAPYYSAFPRPVSITGQCTLKVPNNWPWDAHSAKALALIHGPRDSNAQDGGLSSIATKVLNEVVGWPTERIHIGRVPEAWSAKFDAVYKRIADDQTFAESILGNNPIMAGKTIAGIPGAVGSAAPISGSSDAVTFSANDISIVMATIRKVESGNDYKAINKGDGKGGWATGAYQFMTGTWKNYDGYRDAYLAPPSVQDARAKRDIETILAKRGSSVVNVPYSWYYPKVFDEPALLDKIPAENEGNKLTIRQYGAKWVGEYVAMYRSMRGGSPTSGSPGTVAPVVSGGGQALYPIPAGIVRLYANKDTWGGYENGKVPASAMSYTKRTGQGHPAAIQSYTLLLAAADKANVDLSGSCFRSYESQQVGYARYPKSFAKPGTSNHGYGLAIDITVLTGSNKRGYTKSEDFYGSPEYKWLRDNAWKYGWGHPPWAQQNGSVPEPWHWEFLAFQNFKHTVDANPGSGANPFSGDSTADQLGQFPGLTSNQLFSSVAFWEGDWENEMSQESETLAGFRAPMNDRPVMETIKNLIGVAGRNYCAAPNGDFCAWFPDYWGEYGLAGRVNLQMIELQDFSVDWDDSSLITHQFVEGAFDPTSFGPLPGGVQNALQAFQTYGVATVEIPRFLEAVVNVGTNEYPWMKNPTALLERFGARISRQSVTTIIGAQQEFWYAVQLFTHAWASQFSADVPMTFMPELYPGMLLGIPDLKVQFYVSEVTHSFDFTNDFGFKTSANVMAPSATDGSGFFLFPKGGLLPTRSPSVGRRRAS